MHLNRKRPVLFYGWSIVGACFLINLFANGLVQFAFTAFFEPIATEFGWSYTQVSLAASIRGLEMGLLSPVAGLAVDRYGPRRLVFLGALFLGFGMTLLSQVSTLIMFYGAFILITIGMSACTGAVVMTAVAHWFRRKASMAMGISLSGTAAGGLIVPLATILIGGFGWRMAILSLGLGICGIILMLSLLLRHKPEKYGYLPDGAVESQPITDEAITTTQIPDIEPKMGPRQVLASRTFWHIALSYLGAFFGVTAVLTHIMPYLSNIGIVRATSSLLAGAVPLVTIIGRLGFGWLGDKFNKRWLATITVASIGLGLLSFAGITFGGIWLALPFLIFLSIGWGGNATMLPVLVRTYFGRSSFGAALGFVMGISWIGQILGSPIAGLIFDTWGSYLGAWLGFAILVFVAAIIMATTPPTTISVQFIDRR